MFIQINWNIVIFSLIYSETSAVYWLKSVHPNSSRRFCSIPWYDHATNYLSELNFDELAEVNELVSKITMKSRCMSIFIGHFELSLATLPNWFTRPIRTANGKWNITLKWIRTQIWRKINDELECMSGQGTNSNRMPQFYPSKYNFTVSICLTTMI